MAGGTLGVLLAAGQSRRFGVRNKLLDLVDGQPLVLHAAQALMRAGCDDVAAVVSAPEVGGVLPPAFRIHTIAAGQEMAVSFRAAIGMARQMSARRVLIALGDMPDVRDETFRAVLALGTDAACLCGARRLPPVVLMADSFDLASRSAKGDAGARALVTHLPDSSLIHVSPQDAVDIDTLADLAARAR